MYNLIIREDNNQDERFGWLNDFPFFDDDDDDDVVVVVVGSSGW
jgi:hypothetical protein